MSIVSNYFNIILLLALFIGYKNVNCLPCDDIRCKTGSCDSDGSCICDRPDPSTILDGDRPFLGGKFCDEKQIMCDGTNSFWCGHEGICEEIVQGENYTCKCLSGYTGERCEHSGARCGGIFCFHEAECLVEGDVCECPPDWRGSSDCSMPTQSQTDSDSDSTENSRRQKSRNSKHWWSVGLAISCSVGAIVGAVIFAKKFSKKKEENVGPFQQLSQMHTQGVLDEEEDDSMVPDTIHDDNSHL